jgi:hypothetical protein
MENEIKEEKNQEENILTDLLNNSEDLDPKISDFVNENFWELIEK